MPKCILIVEDDPFIAMELESEFEEAGFSVIGPVTNVADALKQTAKKQIDFASLDYNLGFETSAAIARDLANKGVKFVYITGKPESVKNNSDLPPAPVFTKPVDPAVVISFIEHKTD